MRSNPSNDTPRRGFPLGVGAEGKTPQRRTRSLVAGGAGFLGSHLCDRLLELGREVVVVDDLSSGSIDNIERLNRNPHFKFFERDIVDPLNFEVDEIFNLACPASPPAYHADPVKTLKTSVYGAVNLLDLARARGARILQASTSEVYGDPKSHPQHESYWGNVNPIGPRACYDEGKRAAETLFFDYRRHYRIDAKVVRIFNTYGPRMRADDGRVVSNFIVQALLGQDITIYGSGLQTRSFCFVSDLIDGLMKMMTTPAAVSGPINLGNPQEFTVVSLAELVKSMTASSSRIRLCPASVDDPQQRKPDISAARTELGWTPRVPLVEGLARTIDYFDELFRRRGKKGIETCDSARFLSRAELGSSEVTPASC